MKNKQTKTHNSFEKLNRRPEKIFFQGRHTDGQPIWEKNTQHH